MWCLVLQFGYPMKQHFSTDELPTGVVPYGRVTEAGMAASELHARGQRVCRGTERPNMMTHKWAAVLALSAFPLAAADQAWKAKQFPDWTEDDAKEVMTDSPWAKKVTPTLVKVACQDSERQPGTNRRRGGLGLGGPGTGLPGVDRLGQGSNQSGSARSDEASKSPAPGAIQLPPLTLRWESGLPLQEAELKAHDSGVPLLNDHYAIAVFGIPRTILMDDSKKTAAALRKQASLKPDGKKLLKPSSVEILLRKDGPVVVYLFPKSDEITWRDHHIEFSAQMAKLKFAQSFSIDDMVFHGKLEL